MDLFCKFWLNIFNEYSLGECDEFTKKNTFVVIFIYAVFLFEKTSFKFKFDQYLNLLKCSCDSCWFQFWYLRVLTSTALKDCLLFTVAFIQISSNSHSKVFETRTSAFKFTCVSSWHSIDYSILLSMSPVNLKL